MSLLSIQFSADQDKFLREFLRLSFAEQLFADCTLYCWAEDHSGISSTHPRTYRTFKCHRLVLSAYSEFFRHCFLDSAKSEVSSLFLDIEPRTLENILRLIYTGQIEITQSELELFFNASTKLSLKDFKIANSHEVLSLDAEQNHLKRRLTQDESQMQQKLTKHHSKMEHKELDDMARREESLNAISEEPPMIEHLGLVSQSGAGKNVSFTGSVVNPLQSTEAASPSADGSTGSNYTCNICQKQYAYKISLNKHIKSAHAN
ncbi:skeletal muscle fiber differentiation [Tyrophagus putrescentiae]|nr:skeletal muscle fiber differentiation [Tyrophagus putrescentiae]